MSHSPALVLSCSHVHVMLQFLERQRAMFPRLYFVGDEDLLEILGHSKDPLKVAKHLKKMFAGISGFVISDTDDSTSLSCPFLFFLV